MFVVRFDSIKKILLFYSQAVFKPNVLELVDYMSLGISLGLRHKGVFCASLIGMLPFNWVLGGSWSISLFSAAYIMVSSYLSYICINKPRLIVLQVSHATNLFLDVKILKRYSGTKIPTWHAVWHQILIECQDMVTEVRHFAIVVYSHVMSSIVSEIS